MKRFHSLLPEDLWENYNRNIYDIAMRDKRLAYSIGGDITHPFDILIIELKELASNLAYAEQATIDRVVPEVNKIVNSFGSDYKANASKAVHAINNLLTKEEIERINRLKGISSSN